MLMIIKIEPLEDGHHLFQTQSHRAECWEAGYISVPPEMEERVLECVGYCDLIIEEGVLVDVVPSERPEPGPESTLDERVTALEDSNAEMTEALDLLLSGVTE